MAGRAASLAANIQNAHCKARREHPRNSRFLGAEKPGGER